MTARIASSDENITDDAVRLIVNALENPTRLAKVGRDSDLEWEALENLYLINQRVKMTSENSSPENVSHYARTRGRKQDVFSSL